MSGSADLERAFALTTAKVSVLLAFSLWTAAQRGRAFALLARRLGDGTGDERAIGEYAADLERSES